MIKELFLKLSDELKKQVYLELCRHFLRFIFHFIFKVNWYQIKIIFFFLFFFHFSHFHSAGLIIWSVICFSLLIKLKEYNQYCLQPDLFFCWHYLFDCKKKIQVIKLVLCYQPVKFILLFGSTFLNEDKMQKNVTLKVMQNHEKCASFD